MLAGRTVSEPTGITYQATLRRTAMVVPVLVGLLAALVVCICRPSAFRTTGPGCRTWSFHGRMFTAWVRLISLTCGVRVPAIPT